MFPVWAGSGPRSWSAALVRRVQYYIRFVQIAIDQNIIVDAVILNLSGRIPQPPFDHCVAIFSACAQALLQDFWRRSQDKHGDSVGKPTLQLSRTLHVDVLYQVFALRLGLLQNPLVRPVIIAENLRSLQELAARDHGLEILARHKTIASPRPSPRGGLLSEGTPQICRGAAVERYQGATSTA